MNEPKTFRINLLENSLDIGGETIYLQPKTLSLFKCLSQNPGGVISREDIFTEVWSDSVVSESTLNRTVSDLRKALAPLGENIIETVPKRGYKINLLLVPEADNKTLQSSEQQDLKKKNITALAFFFLVLISIILFMITDKEVTTQTEIINVEVLPFKDLSDEGDLAFFSQALATEIESIFSGSSAFEVIQLNSDKVLINQTIRIEGQLFRTAQDIKMVMRIIEQNSGKLLWSGTIERALTNAFEVQSQAAILIYQAAITELLSESLTHTNKERAQDLLHLAIRDINVASAVSLDRAIEQLQQASVMDPENAVIFASLSDAILLTHTRAGRNLSEQTFKRQKAALIKAVELAPESAITLSAQGYDSNNGAQHNKSLLC